MLRRHKIKFTEQMATTRGHGQTSEYIQDHRAGINRRPYEKSISSGHVSGVFRFISTIASCKIAKNKNCLICDRP